MRPKLTILLAMTLIGILLGQAERDSLAAPIQVPVESTFDNNREDWYVPHDAVGPQEAFWFFGLSGGGLAWQQTTFPHHIKHATAPDKFYGDWSALDGNGKLSFDYRYS